MLDDMEYDWRTPEQKVKELGENMMKEIADTINDYVKEHLGDYKKDTKDKIIKDLQDKLQIVCSILLKKDSSYDQWIEKNIGKEYVKR